MYNESTMEQPTQQPVKHPHGAPWYLVIILIVIALGASVAAIWFAVLTDDVSELAETMTEEVVEEVMEEEEEMEEEESADDQVVTGNTIDLIYDELAGSAGPAQSTTLGFRASELRDTPGTCEFSYTGVQEEFTAETVAGNVYLPDEGADTFVERLVSQVNLHDALGASVCTFADSTYVLIPQISGYAFPYMWTGRHLQPYQPVAGVLDSAASLTSQVFDGEILVSTGYGDAGHFWWSYYRLDEGTNTTELIESCSNSPVFDDEGNWVEGKRHLKCSRVWEE